MLNTNRMHVPFDGADFALDQSGRLVSMSSDSQQMTTLEKSLLAGHSW